MLASEGFDPQYGARPLKRVLQREILNKLSKMILADQVQKDKKIVVDQKNDTLEFFNR
jgi:ATP-dependent Clp protease ATP-binding subunit ClpB